MYVILVYDVGEKRVGKMLRLVRKYLSWIQNSVFEGEIPGATPRDCGNCEDMDLELAKFEANKYLVEVIRNIKDENLKYPD